MTVDLPSIMMTSFVFGALVGLLCGLVLRSILTRFGS
jgi:hypothetical protein